ncbi:MAG: helix-turn-helix domain-containing protein [Myxococcaceae bacterium]
MRRWPRPLAAPAHAELLTVPQAAALVQLHPKVLSALLKAGKVPGRVQLGRSVRVRRSALLGAGSPGSEVTSSAEATGSLSETGETL